MMMNRRELLVCLSARMYVDREEKNLILTTAFADDKASFLDVTLDHREEKQRVTNGKEKKRNRENYMYR